MYRCTFGVSHWCCCCCHFLSVGSNVKSWNKKWQSAATYIYLTYRIQPTKYNTYKSLYNRFYFHLFLSSFIYLKTLAKKKKKKTECDTGTTSTMTENKSITSETKPTTTNKSSKKNQKTKNGFKVKRNGKNRFYSWSNIELCTKIQATKTEKKKKKNN